MPLNRSQKIISDSGNSLKRKANLIIKEGLVRLNIRQAILGDKADTSSDHILVDGINLPKKLNHKVFLLIKPNVVISSCQDNHRRKTILSLIPSHLRSGLHPVGRLDLNSRGANQLTNNEELTPSLTHPKFSHTKTYLVWLSGQPSQPISDDWRRGVLLDGEMTIPASIKALNKVNRKALLKFILKEGLNRKIYRIGNLIGDPVQDLQSISISNINLNGRQEGKWRELKTKELISIIN
ncbi:pseudouridine synthase [Prochlorococcus marinus]|uniref:pseudouridine synthase n=1 Tax=Prochlorococcus marinus TaxID=1219 RepID=UPI0022B3FDBA|nr:pseudouridine synthase [Prochlorococcus marinus]